MSERERKGPGSVGAEGGGPAPDNSLERMKQLAIQRKLLLRKAKEQIPHAVQPRGPAMESSASMEDFVRSVEQKVQRVIDSPDEKVGAMAKSELKAATGLPASVWAEIEGDLGEAAAPSVAAADFSAGSGSFQMSSSSSG